jgi:ketosteroid isomerase-like protein
MSTDNIEIVSRLYDAYARMDIAAIDELMADDAVMHVAGHHPLSGDKRGKPAIWEYLGRVSEIAGGKGGFEVHALTSDNADHVVALATGTIRDHRRRVVHVYHLQDGEFVEFWDATLDGAAEDAFWVRALSEST